LAANFGCVQVLAIRRKLFPELSEDCWLLYCDGFGSRTNRLALSVIDTFCLSDAPPRADQFVSLQDWREWDCRLRPFLLSPEVRSVYRELRESQGCLRLRNVARVGIGYVTGANDFFHLRPSEAERSQIPDRFLHPTIRNGKCLKGQAITAATVEAWRRRDEPILLLRIGRSEHVPHTVANYLDSTAGKSARQAYKCRNRDPWYVVPDVHIPDAFLSYMSGVAPALVANRAKCVATNSVHVLRLNGGLPLSEL
jgi:hypothetical protein